MGIRDPMLLRLSKTALIYVLIFLPLHCVFGVLEGAARGDWPLTVHEFWYQSGAWAAFVAGAMLILAIPTVLLLSLAIPRLQDLRPTYGVPLSIAAGPLILLVTAALMSVIPNQGISIVKLLLAFPIAFFVGAAVLGYGAWRVSRPALQPAAA